VLGQTAPVASNFHSAAGGDDPLEVDPDLDATAHEAGVHRVVVGVDSHVVVPGQAGGQAQRRVGQHRREGAHRAPVLIDLLGGTIRVVACTRRLARFSQVCSWALKSSTSENLLPGRKEVS